MPPREEPPQVVVSPIDRDLQVLRDEVGQALHLVFDLRDKVGSALAPLSPTAPSGKTMPEPSSVCPIQETVRVIREDVAMLKSEITDIIARLQT